MTEGVRTRVAECLNSPGRQGTGFELTTTTLGLEGTEGIVNTTDTSNALVSARHQLCAVYGPVGAFGLLSLGEYA